LAILPEAQWTDEFFMEPGHEADRLNCGDADGDFFLKAQRVFTLRH
jgi:hypothetical protein